MRRLMLALVGAAILLVLVAPMAGAADLDCADFSSQAAAQANLDANPSDPNNLDADDDGQACESFAYGATGGAGAGASGSSRQLPFTGAPTTLPIAAGVLLLAGAGMVVALRHRPQH
jgi:hypothetical protein